LSKPADQVGGKTAQIRDPIDYIRLWRDQLIDLTKRNTLLSFKAPKSSSITITHPNASEAASYLVEKGQVPLAHLRILNTNVDRGEIGVAEGEKPEAWQRRELLLPGTLYADLSEVDIRTRGRAIERRTTQEFLDRGLCIWLMANLFGAMLIRRSIELHSS